MVKLTKDQINDVARLKHVFANNLDIAEDYYNQLVDGNPEPKVDESRLTELWKSENKPDQRDYLAHYFLQRDGKDKYDILARKIPSSETDIGTIGAAKLGLYSGGLKIGQGIAETLGIAVDAGSAWLGDKINKDIDTDALGFIEKNYPQINMDDFVGKSTELITQYGTGYGVAKKILEKSALKKGKAYLKQREAIKKDFPTISKIAEYGAPAAISEPFVSTSRDVTLLQAFGLYDKPITRGDDISPEEKRTNLLKQKLFFAAEGIPTVGAISAGLPVLAGFVGKKAVQAGGVASRVAGPIADAASKVITSERSFIPPVLRLLRSGFQKAGQNIPGIKKIPPVSDWKLYSVKNKGRVGETILGGLNYFLSSLRTNASLTPEAMNVFRLSEDTLTTVKKSMNDNLEIISRKVHTIADEMTKAGKDGSAFSQKFLQQDLLDFMTNPNISASILPEGTRLAAKSVRKLLQGLKKDYAKVIDGGGEAVETAFRRDADEYLSLSFKILKEGTGTVTNKAIKDAAKFYASRLRQLPEYSSSSIKQIDDLAEKRVNDLINLAEKEGVTTSKLITDASEFLARDEGFLKFFKNGKQVPAGTKGAKQEILPDAVRKLYGQVDDVRDRVLDTATELASAVVKKRMFDQMAQLGLGKWLFRNADDLVKSKGITTSLQPIQLGKRSDVDVAQSVNNLFTTPEIKQAIEGASLWTDVFITNPAVRAGLQLKGSAQIAKTVLSPVTQIRNVTSAAGFALANGHFGKGASLLESLKFVWRDLFLKDGSFDVKLLQKKMAEYTQEGVVNSNLISREIQLIAEDIAKGAAKSKIRTTDQLFEFIYKSPIMQRLTKLYQSGDDLWKVYGYEFEKSRLSPILNSIEKVAAYYQQVLGKNFTVKDLLLQVGKKSTDKITKGDLEILIRRVSSDVIKNTYPNYNYVPTLVQNLRRFPVGNFISFPAEMMRTSANLLRFGVKEMMSENPEIRAIGAKRLIGFGVALLGIDRALSETGKYLTEMSDRALEGLQRSFAPSWNQEGPLMPISYEKENVGTANEKITAKYINTGYQNPYTSAVQGPFYVALTSINDRQLQGQALDEALFKSILEGFGALVKPFSSEAIFFQNLNDVLPTGRRGQTEKGKTIYNAGEESEGGDSLGEKITKSIYHVMWESLKPGVVDQIDKFARSVANEFTKEGKDKYYTAQNEPYKIENESTALFAGVRQYDVNLSKSFGKYETKGLVSSLSKSRRNFSDGADGLYDPNNKPKDIIKYFYDYQKRNYKIFNNFKVIMDDYKALGGSDEYMSYMLRQQGVLNKADIGSLLLGTFNPEKPPSLKPDSKLAELAREKIPPVNILDMVPMLELIKITEKFNQAPLGMTDEELEEYIFGKEKEEYEEKRLQRESSVQIPITQPQATAATPQVAPPVATGTTQGVTPTETALLSPTELAIRQRSKRTT